MDRETIYERPSWQTDKKYCNKCNCEIYFVQTGGVHPEGHPKAGKAKWMAIDSASNTVHNKVCTWASSGR